MVASLWRIRWSAPACLVVFGAVALLPAADVAAKQAPSCYAFDLTTRAGSNFGGVKGPLPSNSLVSGSGALYGVLHVCAHGVLFPRTVWIGSARYYLNDPLRKKAPIGLKRNTAPFRLVLGSLTPGEHSLTVVVAFRGAGAAFRPFIATRRFRVAQRATKRPAKLFIPRFGQCGGAGGKCGRPGKPCIDKQWPNSACIGGLSCRRKDKYYRQCRDKPFK